ncbi:MAG: DUF2294 domain-containing protein [Xenococcaceae cyanobacterium MO_188.B32]|nr:DUF2294 domain-containing protein [Xenococcaceae cyanobacterium MO_188.B32]
MAIRISVNLYLLDMNQKAIRIKTIEPLLSQKIKDIYQERLEHQLNDIYYKLFDSTLIIILEGTITSTEKLLKDNDRLYLVTQVREAIERAIQPQIKNIIEEVMDVKVVDFLSDTTIDNDLTGAIAIFEFKPRRTLDDHKP